MTAGECTHLSPPCVARRLGGPLARSGASACASRWAGCLWTWQRWWWWRKCRLAHWQVTVAAGQTGGCRAWGFKPSVTVKEEEEKRKKDRWAHRTIVGGCCDEARSALIGYVMCGGGRDGRAAVVVFEGARVSGSGARERKNTS